MSKRAERVSLLTQLSVRPSPVARKVKSEQQSHEELDRIGRLSDVILAKMKDESRECDHLAFVLFENRHWLLENRSRLPDRRNQAVITLA